MTDTAVVRIKKIGPEHLGTVVRVRGWLANKPGGKGRFFLWLRDGSGMVQAIAEQATVEALPDGARIWADVERIGMESSIIVDGEVRAHPKQEGVYELGLVDIKVVQCVGEQGAYGDYPIGKKEHGVDFLMKNRHLWIRGKRQSAILRIRSEVHKAWADFFYERGFYRVDTPIFTPNACEGTTTLFEVDYHGDTVYLSQSGQLYNEADIGALGQVYCFGPTFRAEKSKTRRHLLEFWMLEMEAAYYDFDANIQCQEEMLAFTVKRILERCQSELKDLERDPAKLEPATQTPYPRLRYGDAIQYCNEWRVEKISQSLKIDGARAMELLLSPEGAAFKDETYDEAAEQLRKIQAFRWGGDFGAPDETAIGARYDRPVFVSNFPTEIKGFYFKQEEHPDGSLKKDPVYERFAAESPQMIEAGPDGKPMSGHTVMGADCIGSEGAGEMIGGSQREDNFERLMENIEQHQLPMDYFQWYLDTRRYGNVPHSGFGIGLERFTAWVCGGSDSPVHIREVITFPRMLHQYEP